jgi:hypothetical protein
MGPRSCSLDEMRRDLVGRIQVDLDANLRVLRLMGLAFQLSSVLFPDRNLRLACRGG